MDTIRHDRPATGGDVARDVARDVAGKGHSHDGWISTREIVVTTGSSLKSFCGWHGRVGRGRRRYDLCWLDGTAN